MSRSVPWPDIEPYRHGNSRVPFVWTFVAPTVGPHVMLSALTHGNEPCGAVALKRLLDAGMRPRRGRLTLVFANVEAYAAFHAGRDLPARFLDRDLNRLWNDNWIDADLKSREAARARQLRPVLSSVDYLLDLHSTATVARPFFVIADLAKSRRLADLMTWPPTQQLMPGGCLEGRHLIDYGRFSDANDAAVAMTIECGRHEDSGSGDAAFASAMLFLQQLDVLAPADHFVHLRQREPIKRYRTVMPYVVSSDRFELLVPADGFVSVAVGEVVALDNGMEIRAPFDATVVAPRPSPAAGATAFLWAVEIH